MLLPALVVLYCDRLSTCYRHVIIITTVEGWQQVRFFTPCHSFARRQPFNNLFQNDSPAGSSLSLHRRLALLLYDLDSILELKKEEEPRFEPSTLGVAIFCADY